MKMLKHFIPGFLLLFSAAGHAAEPKADWVLHGFAEPESILADPQQPILYITNISGHPLEADGSGYISIASQDGKLLREKWVSGMDAPKGMAVYENLLYVADLQQLHIVDRVQGRLLQSIKVHDSKMLNDVAVDAQGNLYVSDFLGGGIYRMRDNKITQWVSADTLPHPNGIHFDGKHLVVGTWGKGIHDDFSTDEPGSLYRIDLATANATLLPGAAGIGNLDGIAAIGNTLYVSDWMNGKVFEYKNARTRLVLNAGKHAADIFANANQLYVPMMFDNTIKRYSFN
jgi:sugar lactone lactonase YvrE